MQSLEENNIWELVELPEGQQMGIQSQDWGRWLN